MKCSAILMVNWPIYATYMSPNYSVLLILMQNNSKEFDQS